jgi:hypothetical protein
MRIGLYENFKRICDSAVVEIVSGMVRNTRHVYSSQTTAMHLTVFLFLFWLKWALYGIVSGCTIVPPLKCADVLKRLGSNNQEDGGRYVSLRF